MKRNSDGLPAFVFFKFDILLLLDQVVRSGFLSGCGAASPGAFVARDSSVPLLAALVLLRKALTNHEIGRDDVSLSVAASAKTRKFLRVLHPRQSCLCRTRRDGQRCDVNLPSLRVLEEVLEVIADGTFVR